MTKLNITPEILKRDENFLSGLEISQFRFSLYLIFNGTAQPEYYAFFNNEILFAGKDYKPSPLYDGIDSIESLIDLVGFLTLKPGDTDKGYFKDYTEAQIAWAKSFECEQLKTYVSDFENKDSEYYEDANKFFKHAYC